MARRPRPRWRQRSLPGAASCSWSRGLHHRCSKYGAALSARGCGTAAGRPGSWQRERYCLFGRRRRFTTTRAAATAHGGQGTTRQRARAELPGLVGASCSAPRELKTKRSWFRSFSSSCCDAQDVGRALPQLAALACSAQPAPALSDFFFIYIAEQLAEVFLPGKNNSVYWIVCFNKSYYSKDFRFVLLDTINSRCNSATTASLHVGKTPVAFHTQVG
jgi:hypothetical protein